MKNEDLLKQADFLFPLGTIFVSEDDLGVEREVIPWENNTNCTWIIQDRYSTVRSGNGMGSYLPGLCSNPYIRKDGEWAKVISRPEQYVKVVDNGQTYSYSDAFDKKGHTWLKGSAPINNKKYRVLDRMCLFDRPDYLTQYIITDEYNVFLISTKGCIIIEDTEFMEEFSEEDDEIVSELLRRISTKNIKR